MSDLRTDWLTGRSVIIAENRAARPNEFAPQSPLTLDAEEAVAAGCPFCAGHEHDTPPATYELPGDDGRWQVRVVPNKYPAVTTDPLPQGEGITGAHEVIVESPRHVLRTGALSEPELCGVLDTYARRLAHWRAGGRFPYALVFKNQGPRAGASLGHLHSQLVALDRVPPLVEAELARANDYHRRERQCPYCQLISDERAAGERIVLDEAGYVAFCPYASLQPYEVWLLPSAHEPWFDEPAEPDALERLASVLHRLVGRLEAVIGEPAYNLMLRTTPWRGGVESCGHWRMEVLPRLATFAGLEMTTGVYLCQMSPEHAAPQLRTC